jgi:hypothetical protein
MTFLMKTSEAKKFVKIFARHFYFIFEHILLQPSRTYFHFLLKRLLSSHAVRIRVNSKSFFLFIHILNVDSVFKGTVQ